MTTMKDAPIRTVSGPWGLVVTAALSAVLAGLAVAAFLVVRDAEHDQLENRGYQGAFNLLNAIRVARPKGPGEVRRIVEGFESNGIRSAAIIGKRGIVLAASEPKGVGGFITTPRFREAADRGEVWSGFVESLEGGPAFRMYVPFKRLMGMRRWRHRRGSPPPWGKFEPRDMILGIEVAPDESFWMWNWAYAQAAVCGLAVLALWLTLFKARRASRALVALEGERRRREEMARLGEMSAVLAHEIRNPLGAIKGHLQLALEAMSGREAPGSGTRIKTSLGEIDRIENLVRGLLDYARDPPAPRDHALAGDVARQAVELARAGFESPVPEPEVVVSDDPGFQADRDGIVRALANVVRNALEAVRADGRVRFFAGREGSHVRFVVEDTGPGLDPEVAARAFDPFVTKKVRGVGLGLAVAKRIVEAHGGSIEAGRSDVLKGARFTIRIPKTGVGS